MAKILLVEDDGHMLRVLAMWLAKNGHEVVEARDGMAAAETVQSQPIDIIVSDINMPRMSGVEFAYWLRETQGLKTPVILLSSRCDQSQIASNLVPLGICVHPKPFSPSRLVAQIEAELERSCVAIHRDESDS